MYKLKKALIPFLLTLTTRIINLKKSTHILLFLLLLLQTGGVVIYYQWQQATNRQQKQAELFSDNNSLTKLTLSMAEYRQCKVNDHEISYQGKMYDVKVEQQTDQSIELSALCDEEEDNIYDKIQKAINGNNNHPMPQPLVDLLTSDYILPVSFTLFAAETLPELHFLPYLNRSTFRNGIINTPPPRIV